LIKVFQAPFFAREDTATPMRYAVVSTAINIAGSLIFFNIVGFQAIAAATSVASTVSAGLLIWHLNKIGGVKLDERVMRRLPRILLASVMMGGVLLVLAHMFASLLAGAFVVKFGTLMAICAIGMVAYAVFVVLVGGATLSDFAAALRRPRPASN
jgi:putative peptidoglycan lipid II flippase